MQNFLPILPIALVLGGIVLWGIGLMLTAPVYERNK